MEDATTEICHKTGLASLAMDERMLETTVGISLPFQDQDHEIKLV